MIRTETLSASAAGLDRAAALLRSGGLVAFPTETVYGLGADAASDQAVARIFEAKARPGFNPLIVHVRDVATARGLADFDARAEQLAEAFWPGPLTLVLPMRKDARISALVTAGLPTVALRVPQHPVAQALLAAFGGALAAPSANPSGRISPTRAAHVLDGLAGRIAAVVDGGACAVGVESTILGLDGRTVLLRPGGLSCEAIEAVLGAALETLPPQAGVTAPGQLASHYAPQAALRMNAATAQGGEVWIGFGPDCAGAAFNLSARGDLTEAAALLFDTLRRADAQAAATIAVAPIPDHGLGRAINDRLRRAAAPRR